MAKDKLITIRIESEELEAFKEWTEKRNLALSSFLYDIIKACLEGRLDEGILKGKQLDTIELDKLVVERVDSQIDKKIESAIREALPKAIASLRSELQPILDAQKEVASYRGKLIA
jgi:hypothetical protein